MRKLIFMHAVIFWAPIAASPILTPNGPLYIMNGGSLALTCEIDQDAAVVNWIRNGFTNLQITNATTCSFRKSNSLDTYSYSVTCDQLRRFTMVKCRVNSSDDNTTWSCQIYSLNYTDLGTSLVVKVLMHVSPDTPVIKALSLAAVVEKEYKLNCSTESRSAPLDHNLTMHSYWKQNGVNISLESGYIVNRIILTISNLSRKDYGVKVTCRAFEDQRIPSAESSVFFLNVLYGPDNIQISPSSQLTVDEGRLLFWGM